MAVIKESRISSRVLDAVAEAELKIRSVPDTTSFYASEIMGCRRHAVLCRRDGVKKERSSRIDIRYMLHRMDSFEIIREDMHLSDQEINLSCTVDMLARYMDEHVLVMIRDSEGAVDMPVAGDVYDMVSSMYVLGAWSGLIIYAYDGGHCVFFANPDRKDAKNIIADVAQGGREMFGHMMSGTIPQGEPCKKCPSCQFAESCDAYRGRFGAKDNNESREQVPRGARKDRQEEGERVGSGIPTHGK